MFKTILQNSIKAMNADNKIIRLTWITSIFHSLIATLLIVININSLLSKNYENGLYVGKVTQYFVEEISRNHFATIMIWITVVLFLIYSTVYPIGQAAIIHHLDHPKETIRQALQRGRKNYFSMYEFGFIAVLLAPIVWIVVAFKVLFIERNWAIPTLIWLTVYLVSMNILNHLRVYTRYILTIERVPLYDAIKKSFSIVRHNRKDTVEYMRVQTILLVNFSINLIVVLGIPFLIMYAAIARNLTQYSIVKILIYISFFVMVIVGSYISAIIRAFFAYFWYEIYMSKHHKNRNITEK